jgi:hypothetical protein
MTDSKLEPQFKSDWIAALRSGEYTQFRGSLCNNDRTEFCCLGVGIAVVGLDINNGGESQLRRFGLTHENMSVLVAMNDSGGRSFTEIADYIERGL